MEWRRGSGDGRHRLVRTEGHELALRELPLKRLVILSRDELKQSKLARSVSDPRIRFFLRDVRDRDRLRRAFEGIDVVGHAAVLRQVPAAEYNPFEAVKPNVLGA
jgi:UDP-N-acetylglucosamine 4,6-dehydratase